MCVLGEWENDACIWERRGAKRGQRGGGEGGRARQKICREHVRTGRGSYERAELALGLSHFHGKCVDTLQVLRAQVGFRV